jgi:segregation and condensation protein B
MTPFGWDDITCMSLKNKIESLLFISNKPFTSKRLSEVTKAKESEVKDELKKLIDEYNQKNGGVQVVKVGNKYQMSTSPESSDLVKNYIKEDVTGELTRPSLETLTIIAYRGPITKPEIEQIRGVNCSLILRNLMIRGLVEAQEDKKNMEIKYNVTFDFMKYLGISDIKKLSDYEKLNSSENLKAVLESVEEQQS